MTWDKEIDECFLGTKSISLSTRLQVLIPFRKISPELGKKAVHFIEDRDPVNAQRNRQIK